ncbi:DUF5994 family protein [Actinomadura geliboluensis]|uniref:DUF5994 family protein n=1 Tax=Actinomadura geliboluensis TaxID=882440 RepID=UPI0036C04C9D
MAHSVPLADPTAAPPAPLLPSPAAPRLRLTPGGAGRGVMDGGWWPRSRDAAAELTALVTALAGRPGMTASRLIIDVGDWDRVPLRIAVLGREIGVGRLPRLDHMVAVACGRAEPLLLLVVPPETHPASAQAALARAAAGAGFALPEEILASCDISTARP